MKSVLKDKELIMASEIMIGTKYIGFGHPCYVIAEIGAMYEDLEGMLQLIKKCKLAGTDAVKIQTYKAETITNVGAEFEYENGTRISQYDFFKTYEISEDNHYKMMKFANELGVSLFSTPSDYADVDFLERLGVPAFKTGSDDLTNYPFLEYVARKGKPMIISTGMCKLGEVEEAVDTILKTGNDQFILLHCTVSYPTHPEHANLCVINTLQRVFDIPVGYSNHVPGTLAPVLAASLGACAVEVHVTLDRDLKRPDYQVSLEPGELKEMVEKIRQIPTLLGSERKVITTPEVRWRKSARKSLVVAIDKKKGDTLSRGDIKIMRPGTGIHPKNLEYVVGRTLKKNLKAGELITAEDF